MSDHRMMRFANPSLLKSLDRRNLLTFLSEYREYFDSRGVKIPQPDRAGRLNYDKLFRVLVTPTVETPRELLDALYLIDEMSTPQMMQELIDAVEREYIAPIIPKNPTPADVSLCVWLKGREALELSHARWAKPKLTRFAYFRSSVPLDDRELSVEDFEADLTAWFIEQLSGNGTKVWDFGGDPNHWYLVRHGRPYKRLESWNGKAVAQIEYQPLKYDAILINRDTGMLKINACSPEERELYRRMFGKHAFQDEGVFADERVFSLEPLRSTGKDALSCPEFSKIEDIRLVEIGLRWGGADAKSETWKADHLFRAFEAYGHAIPLGPQLTFAEFEVKLRADTVSRKLAVEPPNMVDFTRQDDIGLMEAWLQQRQYLISKEAK